MTGSNADDAAGEDYRFGINSWQLGEIVLDRGIVGGDIHVRAASVRGRSHRATGLPRQDAYGVAETAGGQGIVVVIADGVSSTPFAHEAAHLAVRSLTSRIAKLAEFSEWRNSARIVECFVEVSGLIADLGTNRRGSSPLGGRAATTVLLLVVKRGADGTWLGIAARVGDSAAFISFEPSAWHPLFEDAHPVDVIDQEVAALPYSGESSDPELRAFDAPAGAGLLLVSDGALSKIAGLEDLLVKSEGLPSVLELASYLDSEKKGEIDDKTMVLISLGAGAASA